MYHQENHDQLYTYDAPEQLTGKMATASFILGIIGFSTGFIIIGLVLDILAIIFGLISLTTGRPRRSLAKAGLLLAILSIILTLISYYLFGQYMNQPYDYEPYEPTAREIQTSDELMQHIFYTEQDLGNGILVIAENSNSMDVDLDIRITYFDDQGDMLSLGTECLWGCAAGGKGAVYVYPPYNRKYEDLPYADYEIQILASATDSGYYSKNYAGELEINSNISSTDTVLATVTNPTGQSLDTIDLACIFYNKGEPVGLSMEYLSDPGKKETVEFYPPHDADYNDIPFDDYEIIVNTAQYYID